MPPLGKRDCLIDWFGADLDRATLITYDRALNSLFLKL